MKIERTERGFKRGDFLDRYGQPCSIQESSLATEAALWLGRDPMRMHLTQDMARDILPLLAHFVEHGDLPATPPPSP